MRTVLTTSMYVARNSLNSSVTRSALSIAGFLILWELSQYVRDLRPIFAYPLDIMGAFVEVVSGPRSDEYFSAIFDTLEFVLLAYGLGAIVGLVIGFVAGHFWLIRTTIYPYLLAIYSTPRIALLPLFVIWLGVDLPTAIAIVIVAAGFTVLVGTAEGVQQARSDYLQVARSFGANEGQRILKVILPASAPYMVAALRLGAGRAIIAAVTAELLVTHEALGYLLSQYTNNLLLAKAFVIVVTIAVMGALLMGVFGVVGAYVDRSHGRDMPTGGTH